MDLKLLNRLGSIKQFEPHDFICIENNSGEDMYILLKGKVDVYLNSFVGDAFKVAELTPGAFFGEMSLLEDRLRSATIIATDEGATVIAVSKTHFKELIKDKDIAFRILSSLRDRAKRVLEQLALKDELKSEKFSTAQEYVMAATINEKDFNTIFQKEYYKIYNMIKYLSQTVRDINEEFTDLLEES